MADYLARQGSVDKARKQRNEAERNSRSWGIDLESLSDYPDIGEFLSTIGEGITNQSVKRKNIEKGESSSKIGTYSEAKKNAVRALSGLGWTDEEIAEGATLALEDVIAIKKLIDIL